MNPCIVSIFILISLNIKTFGQIIEDYTYPRSTRVQCQYHCADGLVDWWQLPDNCITTNTGYKPWEKIVNESRYLNLKWKNIEANAQRSQLDLHWHDVGDPNHVYYTYISVGPFQLSFPAPTFAGGSTKNIPCYRTDPVTISLNPYKNTDAASEGIDKDLTITSHFKWTLPSGWQTTDGKTGTFEIQASSITVVPPASSSPCNIQVLPFADGGYESNQYGTNAATLQITRNLENFTITGPTNVVYHETYHYEVPSRPGVSYSWQLPADWQGSSTTNSIDVTIGCAAGNIVATMTGCSDSKSSPLSVTKNLLHPGTALSGPSIVCSASETPFSISYLPQGATITWTPGPNLYRLSAQGSNPCQLIANGNGESWVEATISTGCGDTTLRKAVWAGAPLAPQWMWLTPPNGCLDQIIIAQAFGSNPAISDTRYEWRNTGDLIYENFDASEVHFRTSKGPLPYNTYIHVKGVNECGSSMEISKYFVVVDCGGNNNPAIVFPNPTTNETTISLGSFVSEDMEDATWDLEVYNQNQGLKTKKTRIKGKEYTLNTSTWKPGVYIIRVNYKGEMLTEKLLVKEQ